jgi:hypothetical protein
MSIRRTIGDHQVDVGKHLATTDGWRSARFNQRPTKPNQDTLKANNTSKIQAIELNIFK